MSPHTTTKTYKCRGCYKLNDFWSSECPSCGMHGGLYQPSLGPPPKTKPQGYQTLARIEATKGERIWSKMPTVDRVFGTDWRTQVSGIHAPSVMLLAGPPGNGKSSLLLQYAVSCSGKVLYLLSEYGLSSLRDTADRCGLDEKQLDALYVEHVETVDQALELVKARRPKVTIYDSFSDLIPPDGDRQANAVILMNKIFRDAAKHNRAVICVAHVNKEEEIALARRVEHIVDGVMRFDAFGEELRLLHCPSKNRFGKIGVKSWFKMGERGLEPCDAPENDPTQKRTPTMP